MGKMSEAKRAEKIFSILREEYPQAKSALNYSTHFELLISTILSAQCTDERVNIVTEKLFKKFNSPQDFINCSSEELEKEIFSTGFYKQKAKSIKNCCAALVEKFGGEVPADFESLNSLPGVGRKTASVVAGNAFGIPSIAVDTHVVRLSNLFNFVNTKNADKIEARLKELLPEEDWIMSSHWLMAHGRKVCIARRPKCFDCVIANFCPGFNSEAVEVKKK